MTNLDDLMSAIENTVREQLRDGNAGVGIRSISLRRSRNGAVVMTATASLFIAENPVDAQEARHVAAKSRY